MHAALPRVFKALADPTRLRIVRVLGVEELNVGEIAEVLGLPQSTISRHLAVLKGASLLDDRRQATRTYCRLSGDFAREHNQLLDAVEEGVPEAVADLARLDQVVSARTPPDAFFDALAGDWDALRGAKVAADVTARAVAALVPRELTVVDIGCGTGALLEPLSRIASEIHAIDRSAGMLAEAELRSSRLGLESVHFHRAPMEALPLPDDCADAALLGLVLRYAARPAVAVEEAARVVRPGGNVVIVDFVRHDDDRFRSDAGHLWLGFGRDEIEPWCVQAGLTPERYDVVPSPAATAVPPAFVATARKHEH